jgi:hypothetical protein
MKQQEIKTGGFEFYNKVAKKFGRICEPLQNPKRN